MENFIVSARKYRPATFISVVGQSHITSTLKNAITRAQLAHAYLFCGPRGVGKTTCARIFAKAINCLEPKDGEACNECESCKAFNEGRSFNIHELDAASNNSVDDIRNLTEQVRIPPQIGRYSVYIIDEVHMLSSAAFNAFLKTLEEPPAHAVFILATTEKHKIIPTILSRCQIYDFNRIRVEDSVGYLKHIAEKENIAYDEESLHIIAEKADGGMRDALSMFDKVVSFCGSRLESGIVAEALNVLDYDTYFKTTGLILEGNYSDLLVLFDEVLRKGFSAQIFVAGLNNHFRNLLMCKNPQTISLLEVTGSIAKEYAEQGKLCSVPMLFESINLLTATDSAFRTSTNQRLHVELALMKLCGMGQEKKKPDQSVNEAPVLPAPISKTAPKSPAEEPPAAQQAADPAIDNAPSARKTVNPAKDNSPENKQEAPASVPPAAQNTAAKPSPSGNGSLTSFSLKDIMSGKAQPEESNNDDVTDEFPETTEADADPMAEEKLREACASLALELGNDRPRLATALSGVSVFETSIKFTVSNETLKEEIERTSLEMKKRLSEISGVRTAVEFITEIKEDTSFIKPVRVEDKLQFLADKNPALADFKKRLKLEIE